MDYPVESFTDDERALLRAHCTNLDRPVFALVNLPETVKGALFARYSRYPGTLRRLLLDEFAEDLPGRGRRARPRRGRSSRAAQLYERIFLGYGDDSVAQLGGAHVACEWVSNVLTKILQRPRLAAYLEQSTRYIAYDAPMPGSDPPPGVPLLPRRRARARRTRGRWTSCSPPTRRRSPQVLAWAEAGVPRARTTSAPAGPRPRAQGQGARPPARAAARRLAVAHGHLRHRPDLRAAHPAPAGPPAARGPPLRRDDPRGAADGDAELRRPGASAPTAAASGSATWSPARRPAPAGRGAWA